MKLKIKELRDEHNLTQKELADKIGNVQRNISNWENGASEPDCETILRLANLFNVSIDELFGKDDTLNNRLDISYENKRLNKYYSKLNDRQKELILNLIKEILE